MLHSLSRLNTEQMIEYKLALLYNTLRSFLMRPPQTFHFQTFTFTLLPGSFALLQTLGVQKSNLRIVSGAEQEYLLLKAKVKHSGVWSPNGWVTIMCCYYSTTTRLCACPEISPEQESVQTLQKSFGWGYKPQSLCMQNSPMFEIM